MPPSPPLDLKPIGRVARAGKPARLELRPELAPALEGLEAFSHVWVFYWFHQNDRPETRATLKVHPRGNPAYPLTGVFANRSPARPNLIGLAACRLLSIRGTTLEVEGLDAWEDSPILDLKPYIPGIDAVPEARVPEWVRRILQDREK
jgi:tRNA-Thr(GGU) m(6)t(6)A37 methyltransferase TsaA